MATCVRSAITVEGTIYDFGWSQSGQASALRTTGIRSRGRAGGAQRDAAVGSRS